MLCNNVQGKVRVCRFVGINNDVYVVKYECCVRCVGGRGRYIGKRRVTGEKRRVFNFEWIGVLFVFIHVCNMYYNLKG